MIVFKNVTKIYPPDTIALNNVSFEIKAGEFVVIIGRSGAGKTTVLKLLRREEKPTKGQIFLKNKNLMEIPEKRIIELRRKIMSIYQDFKLLDKKTVFENIALTLEIIGKPKKEIEEAVFKVAERLKISQNLKQLAGTLSGGEKQKVCLARCLVTNPEVILADEPTGNLDPIATYEIINTLKSLNNEGITIILATHNKEVTEMLSTRVLTLNSGRLIRDEKPGKYTLA
ncbi:MAG: ATP-binding cassette domain-containing protein [Candidatus Aenigmatarchaeota archaeon]